MLCFQLVDFCMLDPCFKFRNKLKKKKKKNEKSNEYKRKPFLSYYYL